MENTVVMEGINSKGFGFAPKMVMKDTRLSIESKAIYMYFSSYCGAGNSAFPRVQTILNDLGISRTRYYKNLSPLVELGYLEIKQQRCINSLGKSVAGSNLYILKQAIDTSKVVIDENCKIKQKKQFLKVQENISSEQSQNVTPQNETHQNWYDINSNSINSNSINNNNMIDDDCSTTEVNRRIKLYKEWFEVERITPPIKRFIANTLILSNELFDLLLEKAHNKNNKFQYLKTIVNNCIKDKECTLEEYMKNREITDKDFKKKKLENATSKTKYVKKNRAHNVNNTFVNYEEDELERLLLENQRRKFR